MMTNGASISFSTPDLKTILSASKMKFSGLQKSSLVKFFSKKICNGSEAMAQLKNLQCH